MCARQCFSTYSEIHLFGPSAMDIRPFEYICIKSDRLKILIDFLVLRAIFVNVSSSTYRVRIVNQVAILIYCD